MMTIFAMVTIVMAKKRETDQTEREISTEQNKWLIQCFSYYVDFKFFSIFCDIALLLCGQIKYFQKRKPVIMSNGCLWRQAVVDRRMQATEMCTPCHHHYATMQLCTPPPPPPLVALYNYALSAMHSTQPPLCNYTLHTTTTMQL